jgi:hypothetical protein
MISLLFTEDFIKKNPDYIELYIQQILRTPISNEAYTRQLNAITNFGTYDRHGDWIRAFSPEELKGLFERNGIKAMAIYGSFTELLPEEVLMA